MVLLSVVFTRLVYVIAVGSSSGDQMAEKKYLHDLRFANEEHKNTVKWNQQETVDC